jgi:hypothetical protein
MSMYREEVNKYKAKRIGQTDAKVVAPKGRKKNVAKPWVVWLQLSKTSSLGALSKWKPWKHEFAKEHDARAFLRKSERIWRESWLEYNGEKVK